MFQSFTSHNHGPPQRMAWVTQNPGPAASSFNKPLLPCKFPLLLSSSPIAKDSLLLPVNSARHLLCSPGLGFVPDARLPPCVALSFLHFHSLPSGLATMAWCSYSCNLHMVRLPASSFPSHSYNLCRNIFPKHLLLCLLPYLRLFHESSVPPGPNSNEVA